MRDRRSDGDGGQSPDSIREISTVFIDGAQLPDSIREIDVVSEIEASRPILCCRWGSVARFYKRDIHGGSIKTKPNCLCHIYSILDRTILKFYRYLENSTSNMIPTNHNNR